MRRELNQSFAARATAIPVVLLLWGASASMFAQGTVTLPAYKAGRTPAGQPDLSGIWQAITSANWDIEEHGTAPSPYPALVGVYLAQPAGLSIVEGGTIPYKPEALAKRDAFRENRLKTDPYKLGNPPPEEDLADPEAKCFQGGVPRATYMPFPFQIVQSPQTILIAHEYAGSPRIVYMNTTRKEAILEMDTWMGQSVGRWEGDTLVVETKGFSGPSIWLDRAGNFYTLGATITERFTAASPYHLMYEATIDDPTVFTRPWKISLPLYRRLDKNVQILEFQCIPYAEEFMYGSLYRKK